MVSDAQRKISWKNRVQFVLENVDCKTLYSRFPASLKSLIAFQVTEAALVPYYCQNDSISAILRFLGCTQS